LKTSRKTALVALFAALTVVLDSLPGIPQLQEGVWYSWIFVMEPLNGLILGPYLGFIATLTGTLVANQIYFRGPFELIFALGAPMGTMITGLVIQRRLKPALAYYLFLLSAFFLSPISWKLPLWGMWDTYLAFVVLASLFYLRKKEMSNASGRFGSKFLLASAFVGLEADILLRIFIFVPLGTYQHLYGFTLETMEAIWIAGAFVTPIQVSISLIFAYIIGSRLKNILKDTKVDL